MADADFEERCELTRFLYDPDWDMGDRANVQDYLKRRLDALGGETTIEEAFGG